VTIVQTARRELAPCHQPALIGELSVTAEALGKNPAHLPVELKETCEAQGLSSHQMLTHAADDAQELEDSFSEEKLRALGDQLHSAESSARGAAEEKHLAMLS